MSEADQGGDRNESDRPEKPDKDKPGKNKPAKKQRKQARKKGEKRRKPDERQKGDARGRRVADPIWAVAHPVRRRILHVTAKRRKACNPAQIAAHLELPLSTVIYHSNVLHKFGALELPAERQAREAEDG